MYMDHICQFIEETNFDNIPDKAKEVIKKAFIDTFGVTVAADGDENSEVVKNMLPDLFQQETYPSSLYTAFKSSPVALSFLIGTMSHVLDYDDVNFTFHGHPSVALIPIILGLAKEKQLNGKDMIEAYAIGFEVQGRIGEAIGPSQYKNGWHTTSTIGIYGAIAAAAKILKLNSQQIKYAFGVASSLSSGTRKNFGTMTKPIHTGFTAMHAYMATKLAASNFTATDDIFSNPMGIDSIMSSKKEDFSSILKLGKVWELVEFGIIIKKYPCCAFTHRSIDAVIELADENNLDISEIEKIHTDVHYKVPPVLIYPNPKTGLEAKFSMQFCLAAGITIKNLNLGTFSVDNIQNPQVQELSSKVEMSIHPKQVEGTGTDERFSEVQIFTKDKVYNKKVEYPIGHPNRPLSEKELYQKFSDCTSTMVKEDQEQLYQLLLNLESTDWSQVESIFLSK
ncbi:MmgE/PrpD family protein [Pseudalkalibacillus sp. A8]|uniref:MmgE/PrpD family protein n=1 Tax=Pseudalkalibacillus sp. A8 TaxID=3382641 RepID=UPI0038B5E0E9